MQWFRFYHEFAGDPSVQMLAFDDQRHFVMVLCFKASGFLDRQMPSTEYRERAIAKALGLDPVSAAEVKRRLQDVDLIGRNWQPIAWDRRQFVSDNSTARVQKFRAQSKQRTKTDTETETDTEGNVTCNVSETLPEGLDGSAWQRWTDYRKATRLKPYKTDQTARHLATFPPAVQAAAVDFSIRNEYQGVFPERVVQAAKGRRLTKYEEYMQVLDEWGESHDARANASPLALDGPDVGREVR